MNHPSIDNNPFGDTEVEYPARVVMKVITFSRGRRSATPTDDNKSAIKGVLEILQLNASDWKKKNSNAGKYVSYSFVVTIKDADQLEKLYTMLNDLDVVKMLL